MGYPIPKKDMEVKIGYRKINEKWCNIFMTVNLTGFSSKRITSQMFHQWEKNNICTPSYIIVFYCTSSSSSLSSNATPLDDWLWLCELYLGRDEDDDEGLWRMRERHKYEKQYCSTVFYVQ